MNPNNKDVKIEEVDFLEYLNSEIVEKYEEELSEILNDLKQDSNISSAIEEIFTISDNFEEIGTKIVILLEQYAQDLQQNLGQEFEKINIQEHGMAKQLLKFSHEYVIKKYKQEFDDKESEINHHINDKYKKISEKAKQDYKRTLKNVVVYQIYQVMNPRRIAGETHKTNYKHNVIYKGKNFADKFADNNKYDLTRAEAKDLRKASANFHKSSNVLGR